jgi:hypothetical protein
MADDGVERRERLSHEERVERLNSTVAAIARDVVRLQAKWVRDSRVVEGRTAYRGELRIAFRKALQNVADRLGGWNDE